MKSRITEHPDAYRVLPEVISQEPLSLAVREGDDRWRKVVQWTVFTMINAEYLGVDQRNVRCPPWRAKRRRVVPGSREATRDTRRAEGAKGDPKGASERGVQSYGRPVCSRNELAMLWRNAG